jgi:hypothetical protein
MKLSQLIRELSNALTILGDCDVVTTDYNGEWCTIESVDSDRQDKYGKPTVIIDTVEDLPPSITGEELGEMGGIPGVTEEDVEEFLKEIGR